MRLIKCTTDLHEDALNADARATAKKNEADVYYIAMMSDIDIDTDTGEEVSTNEQSV